MTSTLRSSRKSTVHLAYTLPPTKLGHYADKVLAKFSIPRPYGICRWQVPTHAPFSITKALHKSLKQHHNIKLYDWYDKAALKLAIGDFFLFHPVPDSTQNPHDERLWSTHYSNNIAYKTLLNNNSAASALLIPYTSDSDNWLSELIKLAKGRVFILCGEIWAKHWRQESPYKELSPHPVRLDMGIDFTDYPFVRSRFNPIGKRRLLYVGHCAQYKNPAALEAIAELLPEVECSHIGYGELKGWKKISESMRFTPRAASEVVNSHDIFISCSRADAQATTILEQMAFGTPVLATPESGYEYSNLARLSINDHQHNLKLIRELLTTPESQLFEIAKVQRGLAERNHSWDLFCNRVLHQIELWKRIDCDHPHSKCIMT